MNIVFIDDNQKELDKYIGIFKSNPDAKKKFKLIALNLNKLQPDFEFSESPDLMLIDFRFDFPGGEGFFHDGYVLATALRNIYQEIPIIIFTRKDIFNVQKFPSNILDIADDIVFKSDFIESESSYINYFASIISGYKALNSCKKRNWNSLIRFLNAPEGSINDLLISDKPDMRNGSWTVVDSANWIRKILIKYPGILYNQLHAATYLGISINAFNHIQDQFTNAIYDGIFASDKIFYWKSELRKIVSNFMNDNDINLPFNLGFSVAFEKAFGEKIEPSICVSSGESYADKICYVLKEPVKTKYSFSYNIDERPKVMDEARVSWKAIRTTDSVIEDLLNPIAREMLAGIKGN